MHIQFLEPGMSNWTPMQEFGFGFRGQYRFASQVRTDKLRVLLFISTLIVVERRSSVGDWMIQCWPSRNWFGCQLSASGDSQDDAYKKLEDAITYWDQHDMIRPR